MTEKDFLNQAREKAPFFIDGLKKLYPDATCSLEYSSPFQLLIATRLSAQCTDARVNIVTPVLFSHFPDAESLASADPMEVEEIIRSTGFHHAKTLNIIECSKQLISRHGGNVPSTMEELTALSGVGRKTANLVLGDAFGQPSYVVDTHCIRLTNRFGLTQNTDPVKIESDLRQIIPPDESGVFCHRLVLHGRAVCKAQKPDCGHCPLAEKCAFGTETLSRPRKT